MKPPKLLPLLLSLGLLLGLATVALADSQVDQDRLNALREVVTSLGKPDTQLTPPAHVVVAKVCWTPHGEFSAVGVTSSVSYGPIGLAAQYNGSVSSGKQVQAVWKYNSSTEPLSVGDCPITPGVSGVANGFLKPEGPLLPGVYEVAFVADGTTLAAGKITIQQPMDIGGRNVDEVYLEALKAVDSAIKDIDSSRAQPAAQSAAKALPLLGAVMNARPKDMDAMAVYELAQAILAIGKMDELAPKNLDDQVLDWAMRSFAHASLAESTAVDASLKAKAKEYADTLQKAIPQMAEAAGKSR